MIMSVFTKRDIQITLFDTSSDLGNNIYNLERELNDMKERDIYIVDVTQIQQKIGSNPIGIRQDDVYMIRYVEPKYEVRKTYKDWTVASSEFFESKEEAEQYAKSDTSMKIIKHSPLDLPL